MESNGVYLDAGMWRRPAAHVSLQVFTHCSQQTFFRKSPAVATVAADLLSLRSPLSNYILEKVKGPGVGGVEVRSAILNPPTNHNFHCKRTPFSHRKKEKKQKQKIKRSLSCFGLVAYLPKYRMRSGCPKYGAGRVRRADLLMRPLYPSV